MMTNVERRSPGLTRAQLFTLLAVAMVPTGMVYCGALGVCVDPMSLWWLLIFFGPFIYLSTPLFLGILALMAAKPQGSLSKGGRVAGLVALTIAFLLSLPLAAFMGFALLFAPACERGQCL